MQDDDIPDAPAATANPPAAALPAADVGISSRDEAYALLDRAAEYLMRAEPHSPVPYLVKRAVSWGAMPLDELLGELLSEAGDLNQLYKLLGMHGSGRDRP